MRGVTVTAMAEAKHKTGDRDPQTPTIDFSIVSPLGSNLIEEDGPYNYIAKEFHPYWAVLLAGRTSKGIVNMGAYSQVYKCMEPRLPAKNMSLAGLDISMSIEVPILTNTTAVKKGDLLVLPYDGGRNIILKDDVPTHADSWPKAKSNF